MITETLEYARRLSDPYLLDRASQGETSGDNFLRDTGERFVPGYRPTSTVDLLMNAPFAE